MAETRAVTLVTMRWFVSLCAIAVAAHPMGNFSASHYTRLEPDGSRVKVTYVLDLAELPSFELIQKWGVKPDASMDALRLKAADEARGWAAKGLRFSRDGVALRPRLIATDVVRDDGAGAMAVLRITAQYEVDAPPGVLDFEDTNFPDRGGWKEIVIRGAGVTRASHSGEEKSRELKEYPPTDPPQDLRARVEWVGGAPANAVKIETIEQPVQVEVPKTSPAAGQIAKGDRLSQLLSQRDLTGLPLLLAFALAFFFGAIHATTPGHGKTMVAAYLVGARGTAMHALLLGATTTLTHTISVFVLGIATYFLAGSFAPQKVTRILEFVSGLSIAVLGLWLLYQRVLKLSDSGYAHTHDHGSGPHSHHHEHPQGEIGLGSLLALGASGGLVPCPSALVLLLTSIAMGKVALGLMLLVSFSLGLASVLVGIGLVVLYAKNLLPTGTMSRDNAFFRYVPVISAGVIVVVGVGLTAVSLGLLKTSL